MKLFSLNLSSCSSLVAATALLLTACAPSQETPTPTAGVDISHYLAVGDTYTAGNSAGGLTRASQEYSFPNLLAQQLRSTSAAATFTQPLLEPGTGAGYFELTGFTATGFPRTRRVAGQAVRRSVINPNACGGADTVRLLARSASAGTLPQNLGVAGLALNQIETANLGNEATATPGAAFNPYFERLLPAADSRTYLQAVTTAAPSATFFTFFMGLDELMPYVRSGGQCGAQLATNNARNQAIAAMTQNARKLLDRLTANGRPGIIARLPALATLPLLRQGQRLQARLQASFGDTARLYIESPTNSGPAQAITERDYVLATVLPQIGQLTAVRVGTTTLMLPYGRDSRNPLRDADVLDGTLESPRITAVLDGYNVALEDLALTAYKMPIINTSGNQRTLFLDEVLFNQVADAISVAGAVYSSEPVRGNFYSLDYYSLTPRGNGLLANAFISAINRAYRATIPAIDVNSLPTVAQ